MDPQYDHTLDLALQEQNATSAQSMRDLEVLTLTAKRSMGARGAEYPTEDDYEEGSGKMLLDILTASQEGTHGNQAGTSYQTPPGSCEYNQRRVDSGPSVSLDSYIDSTDALTPSPKEGTRKVRKSSPATRSRSLQKGDKRTSSPVRRYFPNHIIFPKKQSSHHIL
jgi:hypothetical protein